MAESLFAALLQEDDGRALALLDPGVEYVNPDGAIKPGVRKGITEYVAVVEKVREGWTFWRMHPERFVAVADKVAVVYRYEAKARSSGVRLDGRASALLTFRGRKVVRYEWFQAPDDALKAVGRRSRASVHMVGSLAETSRTPRLSPSDEPGAP